MALLILTTQRHQDKIAERRPLLTLQIALLSERKIAKIIALLEEQRRDNPMLRSRIDHEAEEMARSGDPVGAWERLEAARQELPVPTAPLSRQNRTATLSAERPCAFTKNFRVRALPRQTSQCPDDAKAPAFGTGAFERGGL